MRPHPRPDNVPQFHIHASLRYSSMMDAMRTRSGNLFLAPFEFINPERKRAVADEFNVFPTDDFAARSKQFGVTRGDIDDLGGVEAHGFGDDKRPSLPGRPWR